MGCGLREAEREMSIFSLAGHSIHDEGFSVAEHFEKWDAAAVWLISFGKSDLRERSYQRLEALVDNAIEEKQYDSRSLFRSYRLCRSRSRLGLEKRCRLHQLAL